jgi:hypothetical protein
MSINQYILFVRQNMSNYQSQGTGVSALPRQGLSGWKTVSF